jgi:phage baseplate assembly protein W
MSTRITHNRYGAIPEPISIRRGAAAKYRKRKGLTYPLTADFGTVLGGAIQKTANQGGYFSPSYGLELLKNNLRQFILTERGERVMLPSFGLGLQQYLFEPLDETTYYLVKTDIVKGLKAYFPEVRILSIGVFSQEANADKNQLLVKLTLQLLDDSLNIFDVKATVG